MMALTPSIFIDLLFLLALGFVAAIRRGPDMMFVANSTYSNGAGAGFAGMMGLFFSHLVYLGVIFVLLALLVHEKLGQAFVAFIASLMLFSIALSLMTQRHVSLKLQKDEEHVPGFIQGIVLGFKTPQMGILYLAFLVMYIKNTVALTLQMLFLEVGALLGFLIVIMISGERKQEVLTEEKARFYDLIIGGALMLFAVILFYHFGSLLMDVYESYTRKMVKGLPM